MSMTMLITVIMAMLMIAVMAMLMAIFIIQKNTVIYIYLIFNDLFYFQPLFD